MIHSFLLIGQSNMAGRGLIEDAIDVDATHIKVLRNGRWQAMYRPVNNDRFFSGVCLAESFAEKYSEKYAVPKEIVYAVINCESSYEADAKSSSGAVGLMQVMPSTFEEICRDLGEEYNASSLYDPEVNIKSGVYYLSKLYRRYGVWETVFAAYNAGYGKVDKWLADDSISEDGRLVNIPYKETADYVERVTDAKRVYSELLEKNNQKVETVISDIAKAE